MTLVSPDVDARYIKLGDGGRWASWAIDNGWLAFGYDEIADETCKSGDWDAVWHGLSARRSEGAQTAGQTEVRAFYELGTDCLWITFAHGCLYWCFADSNVVCPVPGEGDLPFRGRRVLGAWRRTDANERDLRIEELSSNLTQTGNYRATICTVKAKDYLIRRINGIEEPTVRKALEVRADLISVSLTMIRNLHWRQFETLTDLIFARSGWQRVSEVGAGMADVDAILEQPTTGERAFVQVKSRASQTVLEDYIDRFRRSGCDRFFFVCHSPSNSLRLPHGERNLHLLADEKLAATAVQNGLFDWLVERSR